MVPVAHSDPLCSPYMVVCEDGRWCVEVSELCDGKLDCPDASDESPSYSGCREKWIQGMTTVIIGCFSLAIMALAFLVCWKLKQRQLENSIVTPIMTSHNTDHTTTENTSDHCVTESRDNDGSHLNEEWRDHYSQVADVIRNIQRGRRSRHLSPESQVVEPCFDSAFCEFHRLCTESDDRQVDSHARESDFEGFASGILNVAFQEEDASFSEDHFENGEHSQTSPTVQDTLGIATSQENHSSSNLVFTSGPSFNIDKRHRGNRDSRTYCHDTVLTRSDHLPGTLRQLMMDVGDGEHHSVSTQYQDCGSDNSCNGTISNNTGYVAYSGTDTDEQLAHV